MKISPYKNFSSISILPEIHISYNFSYEGEMLYLSIDIGWLKWGISFIFKDI